MDCTAGLFNWHYDIDETVYVLEGSVGASTTIGVEHRLGPGDHALVSRRFARGVARRLLRAQSRLLPLARADADHVRGARRQEACKNRRVGSRASDAPAMFGGAR